jgi:hypothetical protein
MSAHGTKRQLPLRTMMSEGGAGEFECKSVH